MSYTMYTPLNVWLDPASVTDVVAYIQTYLSENTIYSETEIETIIHDYLIAHPELIGGVQSVNGKTGTVVLSASDINTENNVTIESVLASLSSQISSIAASVATNTNNITSLTGRVSTAETDLTNVKSNLTNEATARANADTALGNRITSLQGAVGSPLVAATASAMADTSKIYVYTGSESGYTNGNWYYYNGSAWVSGGVYNAVAINTDKTLTVEGMAADAKATGDRVQTELIKSSNYFTGIWTDGISLNADGTTVSNASRGVTDLMPIDPSKTYYFHYANPQVLVNFVRVLMFNASGEIVGSTINSNNFTTTADTVSIRFCSANDYLNDRPNITLTSETGTDVYEGYFTPYYKSLLPEIVKARTDYNGITYNEFGDRITNDEYGIEDGGTVKALINWQLADIVSNNQSENFGKLFRSKYRIACPPTVFNDDIKIDIDWSKYRIYVWGYSDNRGTSPKNIGWLNGTWIAPTGCYIGLVVARLSDDTEFTTVYNEMFDSLKMEKVKANINKYGKIVECINHRGYSRFIPEESEIAYRLSAVAGFQAAEVDVHFTYDGIPVCTHNEIVITDGVHVNPTRYTTTETYDTQLNVENSTFAYLDTFDWGYYAGPQYAGTKILKFEDYLKLCRAYGLIPYIELKPSATIETTEYNILVNLLKAYHMENVAVWFGGSIEHLTAITGILPNAKVGLTTGEITQNDIDAIKAVSNNAFIAPSNTGLTETGVTLCKNNNINIIVWINDSWGESEKTVIQNLNPYVSGVISNQIPAGMALQELF